MARTTADLVEGVLLKDYDSEQAPSLTPFIDAATLVVTRVAACASKKGITLSSDELVGIETWLAAHLYNSTDPAYSSKSTGGASGSFVWQTAMYLEGTRYGQMATLLDYSGCLNAIAKKQRARAVWLGKPPSEQIDVEERD